MQPIIVGISGLAHSGKDTSADYLLSQLKQDYKIIKIGLADRLKIICQRLIYLFYGVLIPLEDFHDLAKKETIRDDLPYFAGQPFKIRTVLQQVGTDVFRDLMWSSIWCDYVKKNYIDNGEYQIIVISDLRLPDEVEFFRNLAQIGYISNFISFKVIRPNREQLAGTNQQHKSEVANSMVRVDQDIMNDTSIQDLYQKLDHLILKKIYSVTYQK